MRTRPGLLTLAAAILMAACAGGGDPTQSPPPLPAVEPMHPTTTTTTTTPPAREATVELLAADLPRAEPETSLSDMRHIARSDFRFGLDLLQVVGGESNIVLSPYSITTALSMLYAGAAETTAEELAEALHLDVAPDVLHQVRNALDQTLVGSAAETADGADQPLTISPANSIWVQSGFDVDPVFLETLAQHYGAGVAGVDFVGNPEGVRNEVNDWVSEQTEDRITELMPPESVTVDTRVVLANAIYFSGSWERRFHDDTFAAPFRLIDGTRIESEFMVARYEFQWQEGPGYEAVKVPYRGDASMVIVVPDSATPLELAGQLVRGELPLHGPGQWRQRDMFLHVPLFDFASEVPLVDALQRLGVAAAFSPQTADFSGMSDGRLWVSDAVHQASISIDQEGTEAAASTAVGLVGLSLPPTLMVDRPFLFWIEHEPTGEVLFIGQVTDPRWD